MGERTCSVEGCGRAAWSRGWCGTHYRRWRIHGDVHADVPVLELRSVCSIEGCANKHYGSGLCRAHYKRERRRKQQGPRCVIPGCGKLREARGWCKLHYQRFRGSGDPFTYQRVPVRAFKKGHTPWNAGTAGQYECEACGVLFTRHGRTKAHRFCSNRCQGRVMRGPKSPNWSGGYGDENEQLRHSPAYKEWRIAVFARDNYTCQACGKRGASLHADHIKSWASRPDLRFEVSNGRTMCVACHKKTPTWGRPVRMHP